MEGTGLGITSSNNDKIKQSVTFDHTMFFCYLITSLAPKCKTHVYVGFTVAPGRRIRQHNGELVNGAKKTEKKRPWYKSNFHVLFQNKIIKKRQRTMVAIVYGFSTKASALQFEWALQHPKKALKTREIISSKQGIGQGVYLRDKLKIMMEMLAIPPWCHQQLSYNIFPEYVQTINDVSNLQNKGEMCMRITFLPQIFSFFIILRR